MDVLEGSMKTALHLTRTGRLVEATSLLQRTLAGHPRAGSSGSHRASLRMPLLVDPSPITRPTSYDPSTRPSMTAGALATSTFEWHETRTAAGSRRYRLYVPTTGAGLLRPLVLMLHGCTQTPDDFAAGTRMNDLADELGFIVAYPEQPRSANPSGCWNWFRSSDQKRDAGEPSIIAALTREIVRANDVDADRIFVAGLSAGGAAAVVLGQTYPDLFAAVGVHSGLACGAARDMPSAFAAMRSASYDTHGAGRSVPTIVFQGAADRTVHPGNGSTPDEVVGRTPVGVCYVRRIFRDREGHVVAEAWAIDGMGHAWSGGSPMGSYTDARGPDASKEMMRFFLDQ